jgi:hypothetical protein
LRSSLAAARSTWTSYRLRPVVQTELGAQVSQGDRLVAGVDAGQCLPGRGQILGVLGPLDSLGHPCGHDRCHALTVPGDVGDPAGVRGTGHHVREVVAGVGDRQVTGRLSHVPIVRYVQVSRLAPAGGPPTRISAAAWCTAPVLPFVLNRHQGQPRPDLPCRYKVLRPVPGDRVEAAGLGRRRGREERRGRGPRR